MKENTGSEYRIGLKSFHDLYPSKVNEKIMADAKFKTWDAKHKTAIAVASKRSTDFDTANTSSMNDFHFLINCYCFILTEFNYFSLTDSNLSYADKLVKEDIDSTLEYLQMLDKQYADVKTFYDILLYQTNNGWKCAIDVALDVSKLIKVDSF